MIRYEDIDRLRDEKPTWKLKDELLDEIARLKLANRKCLLVVDAARLFLRRPDNVGARRILREAVRVFAGTRPSPRVMAQRRSKL